MCSGKPDATYRIGITGGIATGKTTVSHYLNRHYQIPVLDADLYAREAVQLGSVIWRAIADHFGPGILQLDGQVNRKQLGELVFNNPQERCWLEHQIHPYVGDRLKQEVARLPPGMIVVLAIPLLFEAQLTDLVQEIWVVFCTPEQQLARLMDRNHLKQDQALARINSQMSLAAKCDRADVVLDNTGTLATLYQQIDQVLGSRLGLGLA